MRWHCIATASLAISFTIGRGTALYSAERFSYERLLLEHPLVDVFIRKPLACLLRSSQNP